MSEKYITNIDNIKETLDKYGVAIIPNLLNDDECDEMINEMWIYLEQISKNWEIPIKSSDFSTWGEICQLYLNYQHLALLVH